LIYKAEIDRRAFTNVEVDGITLDTDKYLVNDTTAITLPATYLNTLSTGQHTLTVNFLGTGAYGTVALFDTFTILPDPTIIPPIQQPVAPSYG
jgi:hypothetical protein